MRFHLPLLTFLHLSYSRVKMCIWLFYRMWDAGLGPDSVVFLMRAFLKTKILELITFCARSQHTACHFPERDKAWWRRSRSLEFSHFFQSFFYRVISGIFLLLSIILLQVDVVTAGPHLLLNIDVET